MIHGIFIPGEPVPWKRPCQSGKRRYTDKAVRGWMDKVMMIARSTPPSAMLHGPIAIDFQFQLPVPASNKHPERLYGQRVTVKPDCDNLSKCVMDAIEEAGWFEIGDQQASDWRAVKVYAPPEKVGVVVTVQTDDEEVQLVGP